MLLFSCSKAPILTEEPAGRIVLAEYFTFARCTYCPWAERALDSLSKEYGDSLAVLAYHRRVTGDTLSPDYVGVRESLYNIRTSPSTIFDGTSGIVQTEDTSQNYPVFRNWIISERNIAPMVRLGLETVFDSSSVQISLTIVTLDSIDSDDLRAFFVVCEDSVYFAQAGAPESIFHFVVRKMIPDENGTSIILDHPDSIVEEMNSVIPGNWNPEKIGVVAFLQDMASKEVLQAVVDKRIAD